MSDKIKNVLIFLFIVSALLLMIGSVSAINTDELNKSLETSYDLDNELSVDSPISDLDNKVSSQLTISNLDEETGACQSINEDLNSTNVVSNSEDTTIYAKDGDRDNDYVKLGNPHIILNNTVLNPVVNVGDTVSFEIFGRNIGDNYGDEWIPINML